ncbi:MAG: LURP-one-related/scramblase family protein [Chloroflexota bacterium]
MHTREALSTSIGSEMIDTCVYMICIQGSSIVRSIQTMRNRRVERRENRQEERAIFGRRGSATRYKMRQEIFTLGQDFFIEDEQGQKVFLVDGKVLRLRDTLHFKDLQGNTLCEIQQKIARIRDTMDIDGPDGKTIASVKKALIAPLRDRWIVKIGDGPDLQVQGNILDHEYTIGDGDRKVAEVSKKWFRLRDTYGVEIAPDQNDVVILAVTVVVDMMAHEGRTNP